MNIFIIIGVAVFILGAGVGSFLSVLIYRIHHGEPGIIKGRSQCTSCKVPLKARDLIPLLSFLFLRGRCRSCSKEISYMYPLIELFTGVIFVLFFITFPFVDSALVIHEANIFLFLLHAFYTAILIFTFFYDLKYMEVVDSMLLPAILIGLIATIASPLTPDTVNALIGGLIGGGFFALQWAISKGRWVGGGDIRVGAFIGIILGWQLTVVALVVAYLVGSLVAIGIALKKGVLRGVRMPLAPLLVIGTFVAFFFGNELITWYREYLGL